MSTEKQSEQEPITFTQYLMPDGRTKQVTIMRPAAVVAKARAVTERGLAFECEMLSDYRTISLTVADHEEGVDVCIELVENGPEVLDAVDRLVESAYSRETPR